MSNTILERIHHILGNLVLTFNTYTQTYVDKDDPCMVIFSVDEFTIISKTNRKKGYSPGKFIFVRDTILLIKHEVGCELTRQ